MLPDLNQQVHYYDQLLDFTYQVINSMKGKKEPDARKLSIEHLATKIFLHAVTVRHLRNGSNVNLAAFPDGAHIVDFGSVIVITRSILETYFNLFETFFEPMSDDVFAYRYAVFSLNGYKSFELSIQRNPNPTGKTAEDIQKTQEIINDLENIRNQIKQTQIYQTFNSDQKKSTLQGSLFPKRKFAELAAAIGFGKNFIEDMYMYMSAFTHGDSLSVLQIINAETDDQRDTYFQIYMSYTMMILSLLIRNYANSFPEAKAICDAKPEAMSIVNHLIYEVGKT